jgi:hypothetical protein
MANDNNLTVGWVHQHRKNKSDKLGSKLFEVNSCSDGKCGMSHCRRKVIRAWRCTRCQQIFESTNHACPLAPHQQPQQVFASHQQPQQVFALLPPQGIPAPLQQPQQVFALAIIAAETPTLTPSVTPVIDASPTLADILDRRAPLNFTPPTFPNKLPTDELCKRMQNLSLDDDSRNLMTKWLRYVCFL